METLLNVIDPFFASYNWNRFQTNNNAVCYKNQNPYDEFVIKMVPRSHEISVSVPVDSVLYKQTFQTVSTAIEYITMHLDYYQRKKMD